MTSEKPIKISKEELKQKLTPEQYEVCVNKGTEMPFTGKYNDYKKPGVYKCMVCGNELFSSDAKFDSNGMAKFLHSAEKGKHQRGD
jgi:peptide-methionine (R)-S-oxide reductase